MGVVSHPTPYHFIQLLSEKRQQQKNILSTDIWCLARLFGCVEWKVSHGSLEKLDVPGAS